MAWKKLLADGDPITDLTGTAYRLLIVDSAGDVVELAHGAANKVLTSGGAAADPTWSDPQAAATLDAIGDVAAITEAQGQVLFRSATAWDALAAGTSGYALLTQGAAANPIWGSVAVLSDTVPNTIQPDDAASAGSAAAASRQDHEHAIVAAAPTGNVAESATAAEGTATSFVRSDHVHGCPATWAATAHLLGSHTTDTLANLNAKVTDATLIDTGDARLSDTRTPTNSSVGAAQINATATDIAFAQIILTPAVSGTGTTEGSVFYDSDDNHLYVYVV